MSTETPNLISTTSGLTTNTSGGSSSVINGVAGSGATQTSMSTHNHAVSNNLDATAASTSPAVAANQVLDKKRLQELVKEVDVNEQLDDDVEELLLHIADDFIEQAVSQAAQLAKHRRAPTIETKDIQLVLERNWNMWIPGFGTEEIRSQKRSAVNEAHRGRMALIRKSLKKY